MSAGSGSRYGVTVFVCRASGISYCWRPNIKRLANLQLYNPPSTEDVLYFCDESSQVTDPFAAVAGLALRRKNVSEISNRLLNIKNEMGKKGEVKWKNAKSYGGRVHLAFADYFFDLIQQRKIEFHVRFSKMSEYDHKLSGERRKVDTVSKSFYQLLLHRAYRYYHNNTIYVYPDNGEYTAKLPEQRGALNHQGLDLFGGLTLGAIRSIEPRSSETEPLLQLLDVPLGALAACRNQRHIGSNYSPIKAELVEYVFKRTRWQTICGNTSLDKRNLNKWNAIPKLKRDPRP